MVAVRILTSISGLEFSWHPGEEIDLPEDEAAKWCDNVRACYVDRPGGPVETTDRPGPQRTDKPARETTERPAPPPRSGPGSGDRAWRTYAAAVDVVVPAEAKREQVWQLLQDAGVPVDADPESPDE
ncbi:hypothetical protein [Micromonospora thermarum]|uniref:Lsr2 protein n=1 Tax=Micromonospora thermarum TaxID=2720024 RepID=A0ABX0Z9N5_9ACTN|nr:hypothetical protein [Micromonospora thermarum]NJP33689.1 hypothetical protein [Micromonospora thermarum]